MNTAGNIHLLTKLETSFDLQPFYRLTWGFYLILTQNITVFILFEKFFEFEEHLELKLHQNIEHRG